MKAKHFILYCCSILSGLLTIFTGIAWINNVYLSWYKSIWLMPKQDGKENNIQGIFHFFDKLTFDHSTVSLFIPFFGFLLIAVACLRIISGFKKNQKKQDSWSGFPFFQGYSEFTVALGLIGTVWGLIMIGYFPELDELKISDVIKALHTALFSTLFALVWVYIVVQRVVNPIMMCFIEKHEPLSIEKTISDFESQLSSLNSVIKNTTQNFDDLKTKINKEEFERFSKSIKNNVDTLSRIEKLLSDDKEGLIKILNEIKTTSDNQLTETKKISNTSQISKDSLENISQHTAKIPVMNDLLMKSIKVYLDIERHKGESAGELGKKLDEASLKNN